MKTLLTGVLLLGLTFSAQAVTRPELDRRLQILGVKLDELQANPAKRVPPEALRQACGVILLQRSRGGFIFGYQGGYGVAMTKDSRSGQWSPPVFLKSNEGSFGAQIGGQTSFTVVLLMNTNSIRMLSQPEFNFAAEARGTAGDQTSAEQETRSRVEPLTQVYSDVSGLYGGAVLKGGGLSPDTDADVVYYGQYLTVGDILSGHTTKPTQAATYLADKLNQYSR